MCFKFRKNSLPICCFFECRTVTHSVICPNSVCWSAKLYPLSATAGNRGTLDIIQNPVFLSKAYAPNNKKAWCSQSL